MKIEDNGNRRHILEKAQSVFFEAVKDQENGKNSEETVSSNGLHTVTFTDGEFRVVDSFWSCGSSHPKKIVGNIAVLYKKDEKWECAWSMTYGGFCQEPGVQVLHSIMRSNRCHNIFCGAEEVDHRRCEGRITFQIFLRPGSTFSDFAGRGEVRQSESEKVIGRNNFFGMSFI